MRKNPVTSLLKRPALYICAIAVAASSLFTVQDATAGGRNGKRASVEKRVEHLDKKLSLTDDQKQKITAILAEADKQMEASREATKEERKKQREAWKAQRDAISSQIADVLTPEQKATYDTMKAEQQDRMKERMEKRKEKRADKSKG